MKTAIALAALALMAPTPQSALKDMNIGDPLPLPEHRMLDVGGQEKSLRELAGRNGLLVIFSCNTCPFVRGTEDSEGWEGRYPELGVFARKHGVTMVLVNSNEAKRDEGDGYEDMKRRYAEKGYNQYYLLDQGHVLADAFAARTTPHVFLFDRDLKLVYRGAVDDRVESAAAVKRPFVRDAITNMAAGKAIDPAVTRNIGCAIMREKRTR